MKLTKIFGIVLSLHLGVILLVMFQPGCQSAKMKDKPVVEAEPVAPEKISETVAPDAGFNSGVKDVSAAKPEPVEFSAPTRPKAGGLIVPGHGEVHAKPLPPILEETETYSPPVNLRPTGLSIYKVERGDTLWGIARKNGVTLSSLLSSNPNLDKNAKLSIGQEIMVPEAGESSASAAASPALGISPSDGEVSGSTYVVQKGDSLSRIARVQRVSLLDLMELNGLSTTSIIKIGQVLRLPAGSSASTSAPSPVTVSPVVPDGASTHVVKKGDNLTRISAIYGTSVKQIMDWNQLSDAGRIRVGQVLIVSASAPEPEPPTAEELLAPENAVPVETENSSVEGFFKGASDDRPIIDVSEETP